MPPSFMLAQLYAEASLSRVAYSALPGAPVQPYVQRRRRLGRVTVSLRRRFTASAPPPTPAGCVPAS